MPEPAKYALAAKLVPVPGQPGMFQEIQYFSNAQINAACEAALARIPDDKSALVFRMEKDGPTGVNAAFAVKTKSGWSVVNGYHYDWKHPGWEGLGVGLEIMKAWP